MGGTGDAPVVEFAVPSHLSEGITDSNPRQPTVDAVCRLAYFRVCEFVRGHFHTGLVLDNVDLLESETRPSND